MEDVARPREYWFERQLWNFWPCHWKGWLIQIALLLVTGGACAACGAFSSDDVSPLVFLPILVMLIVMEIIGRRYSRKPWK
jgi:hypothetical protein